MQVPGVYEWLKWTTCNFQYCSEYSEDFEESSTLKTDYTDTFLPTDSFEDSEKVCLKNLKSYSNWVPLPGMINEQEIDTLY